MNRAGAHPFHALEEVERFVHDDATIADPSVLESHRLGGMAYLRLPEGCPTRERFRDAYLNAVALHLATRTTLAPLVQAWRSHGIEVLLFKGFYLAEFAYANPAERPYKDVDLLIHPADATRARSIARELGWDVVAGRLAATSRNPYSHMEAILELRNTAIDLHRFVIPSATRNDQVPQRLTAGAWKLSREVPWAGTSVRALDPRDSALMGMVLARTWSKDDWVLKPTDFRDLRVLAERHGLTRTSLEQRAEELGCSRTLALVLERCDPWAGRFELRPPSRGRRLWWTVAVWHERRTVPIHLKLLRLRGVTTSGLAQALPHVLRARAQLRGSSEPAALLARLGAAEVAPAAPAPDTPAETASDDAADKLSTESATERRDLFVGIRMGAAVLQPLGDRCCLRSLALYQALRARGDRVTLYFGMDDGEGRGRLHAWVEYDDPSRPDPEMWAACRISRVVASHPSHS